MPQIRDLLYHIRTARQSEEHEAACGFRRQGKSKDSIRCTSWELVAALEAHARAICRSRRRDTNYLLICKPAKRTTCQLDCMILLGDRSRGGNHHSGETFSCSAPFDKNALQTTGHRNGMAKNRCACSFRTVQLHCIHATPMADHTPCLVPPRG